MFKNLRTSTKLFLLCGMFVGSIIFATYSLIEEKQIAIAFVRKELVGGQYLEALLGVYAVILGENADASQGAQRQASVDAALGALATAEADTDGSLHTARLAQNLATAVRDLVAGGVVLFGFALFGALCLLGGAAAAQEADSPASSLSTRPELLDGPGGPKQALRNIGIDTDVWVTQFYQGATEGSGSHDWEYSGKADLFATFDLHRWGLWRGLSVNVHQEWTWGESVNFTQGTLLPVNTAWAWPTAGGFPDDTSIIITQKFGERVSATVGKFNMLDQAYKTPIRGGGGYDNFMNMSVTAPYTGVIPAYLIGGNLTIKTDPAIFSLFVYDPRNAQESDVIEHPFADGVTINGSVTVPVKIAGRTGYQGFKAVYTNLETVDFTEIPELFLPPPASSGPDSTELGWFLAYEFEQFLWQNPANPKQGIGVFGYVSLSQGNPNPLEVGWFFGVSGTSFLPGRDNDRWGVMYFRDNLTPELKDSFGILGVDLSDESGWEIFYNYALTPWFRVTADAQFIESGLSRKGAVFLGLRNQIKF